MYVSSTYVCMHVVSHRLSLFIYCIIMYASKHQNTNTSNFILFRSVLRYILLFKHKAGILPNPPTQPLNRERDLPNTTFTSVTSESSSSSSSGVWKAERSGKFVQSLGSSNGNERAWQRRHQPLSVTSQPPTALKLDQTAGEALYIARPLAHCKPSRVALFY